ncbi:MAG: tRNA guanosine-2 -O-methyltransferase TRM13 protein [Trebouxia sp. A1-2]|nr:MAG: tRNA guanosine-2 -O-methyltransferase TRM13 protein [Trebouxia sp. A1-2]
MQQVYLRHNGDTDSLTVEAQPYCQPGANAGRQEDALHLLASNNQSKAGTEQGAASPQQYVQASGQEMFLAFIHRIVKAHQQASMAFWHTRRPLSIGDINAERCVYIEFGAGKGYLSSMLADASAARHFVLLDMRSFRMKADRQKPQQLSLRKLENLHLQRLRVDIKDFQPTEVPGLNNGLTPWIATGKHLCGAATDFTLRCCASSMQAKATLQQQHPAVSNQSAETCPAGAQDPEALAAGTSQHQQGTHDSCPHLLSKHKLQPIDRQSKAADASASCHFSEAQSVLASSSTADQSSENNIQNTCSSQPCGPLSGSNLEWKQAVGVQGLAVATCCHHRCSWQHYVGKPLFKQLGFSPDEFEGGPFVGMRHQLEKLGNMFQLIPEHTHPMTPQLHHQAKLIALQRLLNLLTIAVMGLADLRNMLLMGIRSQMIQLFC